MVIVILLTILDLITAMMLVLHVGFGLFSQEVVLYNAVYLIVKGLLFFKTDFASKVDILVGIYMVMIGFDIFSNQYLTIGAVVWLAQKGVMILISTFAGWFK